MPNLIATRIVRYGGRDRQVDEQFEASDKDAKLLVAIGKARLTDEPAPVEEEDSPAAPKPKSGAYKRRDLQAEALRQAQDKEKPKAGRTGKVKRSRS